MPSNRVIGLILGVALLTLLLAVGYVLSLNHIVQVADTSTLALPASCEDVDLTADGEPGAPVITSVSTYKASVGTQIEIRGCNFLGFEGDRNAWIENSKGERGFLFANNDESNAKVIKATIDAELCERDISSTGDTCEKVIRITPGVYKLYTTPWGKKSNEVSLTIQ